MKLTEEQKNTFVDAYGEKATKLIEIVEKKKGKLKIFNEDNTLIHSKEETEKRIMKTSSSTNKVAPSILFVTWIEEAKKMKFSSIQENEKALEKVEELKKIIEGKKQASIDKSIKALEKIIKDATGKLKELKGEDQSKPTTEAEQKEGEAEAAN